jgi:outer membrane protein TolC
MKTLTGLTYRCILAYWVFLLAPAMLTAQNKSSAVLTLNDCISLAIDNSYTLQSDSLLIESLRMVVNQEQSLYYPKISAAAGISGLFLSPYTFGQHYLQAVADWDLGKPLKKTAEIQQKQVEQQQILSQNNKLEITSVITGLYLDILQNQLELQILQARLNYLTKHLEILKVMWKAGTIKQLDILQTQSTVNNLQEQMLQKELSGKQAKYAMTRIIGFNSPEEFLVDSVKMALPSADIIEKVPDTWFQNHPQALVLQKKYEKELLMKKEVEASYLPHLQMISGYTLDGDPTGDGNYVLLGLGATIPIYSWKRKEYQLSEIDFTADAIQSQKKNVERDLAIRFDQVSTQIRQSEKIINFQKVKLQNDQEAAKVAELNYQSGLATNLDFLTAQQKLTETKLNINTIRNQYLKSVVAFWLLTNQVEEIKNIK